MMILDGKHIKSIILDEIQEEVKALVIKPKLVVVQVGNNEASNVYIKQKSWKRKMHKNRHGRMCQILTEAD